MKNLTWPNPEPLGFAASRVEELFVAQVLIKKVKLKCCGIKEYVCEPGEFEVMIGPNSRDVKSASFVYN